MTLYDAAQSFGQADDTRSDAVPSQMVTSQVTVGILDVASQFARSSWKAIVVVLLLFTSLFAAEWFVTYCGFSNRCPVVQQVAELPASKLQFLPLP
jgi:hypothetical protein